MDESKRLTQPTHPFTQQGTLFSKCLTKSKKYNPKIYPWIINNNTIILIYVNNPYEAYVYQYVIIILLVKQSKSRDGALAPRQYYIAHNGILSEQN